LHFNNNNSNNKHVIIYELKIPVFAQKQYIRIEQNFRSQVLLFVSITKKSTLCFADWTGLLKRGLVKRGFVKREHEREKLLLTYNANFG